MQRRLLAIALCGYIAVLAMAAWPTPLRPALLDGPHHLAVRLLKIPGWRAGQDVFTIPYVVTESERSYCTHAKAVAPGGEELVLRPTTGRCRWEGFRWHTPALDIVETKFFAGLRQSWTNIEGTPVEARYLGGLGRYLCREANARGLDASTVRLIHYGVMGAYADGSTRMQPYVQYEWSCREDAPRGVAYAPDEEAMRAFWGSDSPWP